MARKADTDKQFLELHHGKWRVVLSVPRNLQKSIGSTKLKRQLPTDSLAVANELKWAIVKELKNQIRDHERRLFGAVRGDRQAVLEQAAEIAMTLQAYHPDDRDAVSSDIIEETVQSIIGEPVAYSTIEAWMVSGPDDDLSDAGMRIPIYDTAREKLAEDFVNVALHGGKPIASADADYRKKRLKVSPKTEGDHERAITMLAAFCIQQGIGDDIAKVDDYVVTDFIAFLENKKGLAARTIKKYVSRLHLYFAYAKSLRQIAVNPWKDAIVYMPTEKNQDKERPFTAQELVTLLTGKCKQVLHDLMMIGALTGARLDAIVDLKVGDIIDGNRAFRFKIQKRELGERYVPIHPLLKEIVARRVAGKKPEDDFFPEYPADPSQPKVERSSRASKHFTTYRRSVGVDDVVSGKRRSRANFHSFRRWFVTAGLNAHPKPPEGMISALVGHSQNSITLAVYYEGPEMKAARKAVERIKLPPLDGSPVIQPQSITPR